jgi:hypothetical protein
MTTDNAKTEAELLTKINEAIAAHDEAQKEQVSRAKTVGLLLLEAKKKLHLKGKDFEAFVDKVEGIKVKRSWAYDCIKLAGGRITEADLKKGARERAQRSRAKKKSVTSRTPPAQLPPPEPPQPEPPKIEPPKVSVTPPVTGNLQPTDKDGAEATVEERKTGNAVNLETAEEKAARLSAHNLAEFTVACRLYLPKMTTIDRSKAYRLVARMVSNPSETEAA